MLGNDAARTDLANINTEQQILAKTNLSNLTGVEGIGVAHVAKKDLSNVTGELSPLSNVADKRLSNLKPAVNLTKLSSDQIAAIVPRLTPAQIAAIVPQLTQAQINAIMPAGMDYVVRQNFIDREALGGNYGIAILERTKNNIITISGQCKTLPLGATSASIDTSMGFNGIYKFGGTLSYVCTIMDWTPSRIGVSLNPLHVINFNVVPSSPGDWAWISYIIKGVAANDLQGNRL